jgi:FlaA1/EpsC-like NDP-sugar epimerase
MNWRLCEKGWNLMSEKLLLIGGGGHCKTVIEAFESRNNFEQIGIIDLPENIGKYILDCKVIGSDQDLKQLRHKYNNAFISMGSIGDPSKRIALFRLLQELQFKLPTIIDKTAYVSPYAKISEGTFVGKSAVVNADTVVDHCAILLFFSHSTGCCHKW